MSDDEIGALLDAYEARRREHAAAVADRDQRARKTEELWGTVSREVLLPELTSVADEMKRRGIDANATTSEDGSLVQLTATVPRTTEPPAYEELVISYELAGQTVRQFGARSESVDEILDFITVDTVRASVTAAVRRVLERQE